MDLIGGTWGCVVVFDEEDEFDEDYYCEQCGEYFYESHYHCGNCGEVSGMFGHFSDGQFSCPQQYERPIN